MNSNPECQPFEPGSHNTTAVETDGSVNLAHVEQQAIPDIHPPPPNVEEKPKANVDQPAFPDLHPPSPDIEGRLVALSDHATHEHQPRLSTANSQDSATPTHSLPTHYPARQKRKSPAPYWKRLGRVSKDRTTPDTGEAPVDAGRPTQLQASALGVVRSTTRPKPR